MLQFGKTVGFLEAPLTDAEGVMIAWATSSVKLREMKPIGV